jgi:tRNA A37 threonylcarbamoyladenosine modification protein TsaB
VFVDIGPGGYAALRVGLSIAKGLAHGLDVPIIGVGRLELDAYGVATEAAGRRIVAVHRAVSGARCVHQASRKRRRSLARLSSMTW